MSNIEVWIKGKAPWEESVKIKIDSLNDVFDIHAHPHIMIHGVGRQPTTSTARRLCRISSDSRRAAFIALKNLSLAPRMGNPIYRTIFLTLHWFTA